MRTVKVVLTKEWQEYLLKLVQQDKSVDSQFATDVIKALTVHGMPDGQAGGGDIEEESKRLKALEELAEQAQELDMGY